MSKPFFSKEIFTFTSNKNICSYMMNSAKRLTCAWKWQTRNAARFWNDRHFSLAY